jgi:hypothetical protein
MSLAILGPQAWRVAQAQAPAFHIVSDGTAKYTYTEESDWETLSFDDSAWSFVVAPSAGLCTPSPVPPGAPNPIWGEDPQEFQTIFVRKTFTLDAATTANIIAGADDDYDLFINGVFIGGNHDGFAGNDLYTNVPLQAGENVLAMKAIDVVGVCQALSFDIFPPPVPPANDDVANAVVISALNFTDTRDTRGATTAPDDPGSCFGGTNVWYTFTPSEDTSVRLTTTGSSYEAGLDVFASTAEGLQGITCGSGELVFAANAGTTYYFMVSSPSFGGDLIFSVLNLGPPLDITLVVNARGSFTQAGAATISGTVMCNTATSFTDVSGSLQQRAGRQFITGSFSTGVGPCSPPSSNWSATVMGSGVFRGGAVTVDVSANACDDFTCDGDAVRTTIQLKGGK